MRLQITAVVARVSDGRSGPVCAGREALQPRLVLLSGGEV